MALWPEVPHPHMGPQLPSCCVSCTQAKAAAAEQALARAHAGILHPKP